MFVVLHAEAVPSHLKGYVDRLVCEIQSSLYVGNVSRRVADELWDVLTEHRIDGAITMILSTSTNEQGYEVRLAGRGEFRMIDFDGVELPGWSRKVARHAH